MKVVDIWCELTRLPRAQDSTEPAQLLWASLDNFGGFFDWLDANFGVLWGAYRDSDEDSDLSDEFYWTLSDARYHKVNLSYPV